MIYNEHVPITCLQNQSKMDFTKTIAFLVAVVATEVVVNTLRVNPIIILLKIQSQC